MNGQISFKLEKNEIIRGYKSFETILNDSKQFRTNLLTGFLKANKISLLTRTSPQNDIKVGFIISKKKFRKSYKRNKLRRLLKESFRLNKHIYSEEVKSYSTRLLIGLNTSPELMAVKEEIILNFNKLSVEMEKLLRQVTNYLNNKRDN